MSDACGSPVNGKNPSAWAVIGGALLSYYLPPVFALLVLNRWKEAPKRLRAAAIVLSFLWPAMLGCGLLDLPHRAHDAPQGYCRFSTSARS